MSFFVKALYSLLKSYGKIEGFLSERQRGECDKESSPSE